MLANDVVRAPYATTAIPLFLSSQTGMRYRSLNCMECGQQFLERSGDSLFRTNDTSQPNEVAITSESVIAVCGNCTQSYGVNISLIITFVQGGIPLYLHPESIYIASEQSKKLRYLHCMECGKPFHSISDRISQVVDNRLPFEYVDPSRLGPIECLCSSSRCGQTWALIV